KATSDIALLHRVEIFDEGTVSEDVENIRLEYDAVEKNPLGYRGVLSGLASLDNITNGFNPGELIVWAGMEGSGKSLLMMNMCINAWMGMNSPSSSDDMDDSGNNILYFSLEMPRSNKGRIGTGAYFNKRVVSAVGQLDFKDLRRGKLDLEDKIKLN